MLHAGKGGSGGTIDGSTALKLDDGILSGGYLQRISNTEAKVIIDLVGGNKLHVNGKIVTIPAAGLTRSLTGAGNTKIDLDGLDTAALPAANDTLHAYVSNEDASFSPTSLRYSTVGPLGPFAYGYPTLKNAGNGLNWRYVGLLLFDYAAQVKRDANRNYLFSWLNPKLHRERIVPNYADDNAQTTYTHSSAGYGAPNGTTDYHEFFYHPAYGSRAELVVQLSANTAEFRYGIENGDEGGARVAGIIPINTGPTHGSAELVNLGNETSFADALRKYQMAFLHTPGNATIIADLVRNGSVVDPAATYLDVEYYR